jgi:hypothetical protein
MPPKDAAPAGTEREISNVEGHYRVTLAEVKGYARVATVSLQAFLSQGSWVSSLSRNAAGPGRRMPGAFWWWRLTPRGAGCSARRRSPFFWCAAIGLRW